MIIPVYKPRGGSTHQLAHTVGKQVGEKATHTGTLDPLAEGVVVVLTGNDRFKKTTLATSIKTYQFSFLLGVATDSLDLLGLTTAITANVLPSQSTIYDQLTTLLPAFLGDQQQLQPIFSAKRVRGMSSFDSGKRGEAVPQVNNIITIHRLDYLSTTVETLHDLQSTITERITSVSGDFRQEQCIASWQKTFSIFKQRNIEALPLVTLEADVSKRTYIRALVRDLGTRLGVPTTTFSIIRTKNGPFSIADCVTTNLV